MRMLVSAAVATLAIAATGSALAADYRAPIKAPIMPPPPVAQPVPFTWSGCFAGGHTGLAVGHTNWKDAPNGGIIDPTFATQGAHNDLSGAIGGGQIGCDYQTGNFVFGFEGAFSGSTVSGTAGDQFNPFISMRSQTQWLGTVTARGGFAIDRALVYVRGGGAWTRNRFEL